MKKIMMLGVLLSLCGEGMGADHGADYFESRGVQLRKVHLTPELKALFNLNQGDERSERQSEDEVISLKAQLIEQKLISDYYSASVKDVGVYSLSAMMAGMMACGVKSASYLLTIYYCNDIRNQGGTCSMDACDPQVRLNMPSSSADTCELNFAANISAYLAVALFMGVTVYGHYKFVNAPQQSKYKID